MTTTSPLALFDITPEQISRVMSVFYAKIRHHPVLGTVFNAHIGDTDADWEAHIAKIDAFWRNAILKERGYDGTPMRVHVEAHDILVEHFAPWLALFETVLRRELSTDIADRWLALANRIARGFQLQMEERDRPQNAPPKF